MSVVVGRYGWRTLSFRGTENVLVVGPPRSGKGVGVFIPSLFETPGHSIVVEVRDQTWKATAGYRSTMGPVHRLAPTQPGTTRFSLPQAIRKGTYREFFDAGTIAGMHIDTSGDARKKMDHWDETSLAFLTMALLYEVRTRICPTMAHIASVWSAPGADAWAFLEYIVRNAPTQTIAELGQEVLNKTAREAKSILSSMMRLFFVYRDPTFASQTSVCDFTLDDFWQTERAVTLYLMMSPSEEEFVRNYLRCLLRLLQGRWMEVDADTDEQPLDITLFMDEFPSYQAMNFYVRNLAMLSGRGIRSVLGCQTIPQLRDIYGHSDVVTEMCKVHVYFAANGPTTGKEISQQMGVGTATTIQESTRADGWSWAMADSHTQQVQHHARALLTESEATEIPSDRVVVKVSGHAPIWAKRIRPHPRTRQYRHRVWRQRMALPPPKLWRAEA